MKILDLFCGAGGAGEGYKRAGFEVIGIDIVPQPENPHTFIQGDVFEIAKKLLNTEKFNAIHASPPCQAYTSLRHRTGKTYPALIEPTRELLRYFGLPYVIENVIGAPLVQPVLLCGSMFGLHSKDLILRRHRIFESSFYIMPLLDACKGKKSGGVYGSISKNRSHGQGTKFSLEEAKEAMGIDWMGRKTLVQAIPPIYTQYIGMNLINQMLVNKSRL